MHIDIAGLTPDRVEFATSPLAELGVALHALSEPGHHPGVHGWATATAAGLEPDLADRLMDTTPGCTAGPPRRRPGWSPISRTG